MQATDNAQLAGRGGGGSGRSSSPLAEALKGLYRALQKSSIYPSGHPAIPAAVEQAFEGLDRALAERAHLVVRVTRDGLLFQDENLAGSDETLRSLASLLHELDLAAVQFDAGLEASTLEQLARFLGRARRERIRGANLVHELEHRPLPHVRLLAIDYAALRFAEGAHRPDDEAAGGADHWEALTRLLTDPAARIEAGAIPALASELGREIDGREGTGIGALRSDVHRAVGNLGGLKPEQRDVVRQRLSAFLAGLNTDLRRDLLHVDPAGPRLSLNLLGELADELPLPDLLEALRDVDRIGSRVPDEMLVLLNKLVRISEKRDERSVVLLETLERWGLSPSCGTASPDTREALGEVLRRDTDVAYNPEGYQTLLTRLARSNLTGVPQTSALLYRDPSDADDLRVHAAQVAVQLVSRTDGESYRPALLAYVQTATDSLIECGRFDVILEATHAARAHTALKGVLEETQRAARGFLDEFPKEERIEKILSHASRDGRFIEDAVGLLELGGARAVDLALDQLTEDPPRRVAAALQRFAQRRGAELLDRVLERRAERGRVAMEPVFAIVRGLPTEDALALLEKLGRHGDPRVRGEAIQHLCEVDGRPGATQRHLARALADPDPSLVEWSLGRLLTRDGAEAIELLGRYVEGRLGRALREPESCRRAIVQLGRRGVGGIARLCLAHARLMRSLRPPDARVARIVVDELRAAPEHPGVRRALRRWRFSLNRALGLWLSVLDRRSAGTVG